VPRYAALERDAVTVDLGDLRIRVCSLQAPLAMKRAASRPSLRTQSSSGSILCRPAERDDVRLGVEDDAPTASASFASTARTERPRAGALGSPLDVADCHSGTAQAG
jgi:hypothetical protein